MAMTLREFRSALEEYRRAADVESERRKDSYLTLDRLVELYQSMDDDGRRMAEDVFCEWLLSDDDNLRFDAEALICELRIVRARSVLQQLSQKLVTSRAISAPFELKKVRNILEALGS